MHQHQPAAKPGQDRSRSPSDGLELINHWVRERFDPADSKERTPEVRRDVSEPKDRRDVSELKDKFVVAKLRELSYLLGVSEFDVITVRSSFRKESRYLRPVYSQPTELGDALCKPEFQCPFVFKVTRRTSPFKGLAGVYPNNCHEASSTFTALHRIEESATLGADASTNSFRDRINDFWKKLLQRREAAFARIRSRKGQNSMYCFFAGRNKPDLAKHDLNLKHIVAVYFRPKTRTTEGDMCSKLEEAKYVCDALFDGLDLIAAIDASLFKSEGLELVAALSPEFARENVAPADKIAFAIEKLQELLSLHMVGRHGGDKQLNVFYLAATFEREDKGKHSDTESLMPRLEMYPHVYREKYAFGSFLVAHRAVPSATKFLIKHYMESKKHEIVETVPDSEGADSGSSRKVKLSRKFLEVFTAKKLGTVSVNQWEDAVYDKDKPDFLDMMRYDDRLEKFEKKGKISPWIALNRNLSPGKGNCSIAAFVVEGRTVNEENATIPKKCLPRGVFAIESEYVDAFSDHDIDSLRAVFSGLASLVRQISHQHAPIEYRSRVADAFNELVPPAAAGSIRDVKPAYLLFLVQKLDGKELKALLKKIAKAKTLESEDSHLLKALELNSEDYAIVDKIAKKIVGSKENELSEKRAREELELRMQRFRLELSSEESCNYNRPRVIEFLEACAENFTWVGYLNAMSQCMGDRVNVQLPQFRAISPGYSASGMFMARIEGELRQIVKLAAAEKLRKERHLYRRYVRYKLVNAARISTNGFAFDTRGRDGQDSANGPAIVCRSRNDEAFGVLVSDLVSGGGNDQENVRTFLDVLAHAIGHPEGKGWPKIQKINQAIANVFQQNDKLWLQDEDKLPLKIGVLNSVSKVFRLFDNTNTGDDKRRKERLDGALERFNEISRLSPLKREDFAAKFDATEHDARVIDREELKKHRSIIHGDLNARNLTWADAFSSFFLIDFEHVGPGFKGIDQFRLAVNTVTELFSAWEENRADGKDTRIWEALDAGIDFLVSLFRELRTPARPPLHKIDIVENVDGDPSNAGTAIKSVLASILKTASYPEGNTEQGTTRWRQFWAYVLLCAVLKEFEYSCLRAQKDVVRELAGQRDVCSDLLPDIHGTLSECLVKQKANDEDATYYIRHFVAARLLKRICEILFNEARSA